MGSYLTVLSFLKNPHTTLPAGITRKFIANMLLPKSRQIHPNVDWSFSAPSLTQVCIFCWIFLPPNKMCPIKVSVPNPSFPRRPPSSTVPKLKSPIFWKLGPENSEISPSVLLNRSHCCWIFGKFPCRSIQCSGNIISIGFQLPPFCQG